MTKIIRSIVSATRSHRGLSKPFIALGVALLISSCTQAVKRADPVEPDPDPPAPKPMPTLVGTWQRVGIERDDDGNEVATETTRLTLTGTHYFDRTVISEAGVSIDSWDNAGAYTADSESSLEKTFYIDDDDDGVAEEVSVEKEYLFSGNSLFIHAWGSEHPEERFEQYERLGDLPTPAATTLLGAWRQVDYWDDDRHGRVEGVRTLTLTESRYIESVVLKDVVTGDPRDDWHEQGGWSGTEADTLTKMYFDDDVARSLDKRYLLAGDLLAIECWPCNEPDTDYHLFARVPDPIPGGIVGTWIRNDTWHNDELGEVEGAFAYTITADTFTEEIREVFVDSNGDVNVSTLSGSLTIDERNQTFSVTVTSATEDWNGQPIEDFDPQDRFIGRVLRYGYAATDQPDEVRFSPRWDEQEWNDDTMMWTTHEETPYGYYGRVFTRQQATQ